MGASHNVLFVVEGDRAVIVPLRRRAFSSFRGVLPATRSYPGDAFIRDELQGKLGDKYLEAMDKICLRGCQRDSTVIN